jgi:preprotein translocase subunit SecD
MKYILRYFLFGTALTFSLASCGIGIGGGAQSSSEDVIEFRQVLSVASAQSTFEALGQEFSEIDCRNPPIDFEPPIDLIGCSRDEKEIYLLGPSELDGNTIEQAKASTDTPSGDQWYVSIDFDEAGTKKFAEITARVTSLSSPMNQIAITSGNLVITAPRINEAITSGSAVITGNFTMEEASELSRAIKDRAAIPPFLRWRE